MGIATGLTTGGPSADRYRRDEGRLLDYDRVKEARPGLERETGIEPASLAWKAKVLPLNYSRSLPTSPPMAAAGDDLRCSLVEEAGFEPA